MTSKQDAHKLAANYLNKYKSLYGRPPRGWNRFAMVPGLEAMIEDYGLDRAGEIVDYYLSTENGHQPHLLAFKYGNINELLEERENDAAKREALYKATVDKMKGQNEQRG